MTQLYLCFSSEDLPMAVKLAEHLKAHGFQVTGRHSKDTWEMTTQKIITSEIFLYLVSPPALRSQFWRAQLDEAMRLRKTLMAILAQPVNEIFPVLGAITPIDMSEGISPTNLNALDQTLEALFEPTRLVMPRSRSWRGLLIITAILVLTGVAFFIMNLNGSTATPNTPPSSTASSIIGSVTVEMLTARVDVWQNADTSWQVVVDPVLLTAGQFVRTNRTGTATVRLFTGDDAVLASNSELHLDRLDSTIELTLVRGAVGLRIPRPNATLLLHTATATAIASGNTHFEVTIDNDGATIFRVVAGTIEVETADGVQTIHAGDGLVLEPRLTITLTLPLVLTSPDTTPHPTASPTATHTASPSPTITHTATRTAIPTRTPRPTRTFTLTPTLRPTIDPFSVPCPNTQPPRLRVYSSARVTIPIGVNLRRAPGITQTLITNVPLDTVVNVVDGPVCADGFLWWQIELSDGQVGWSAESEPSLYYLEPVAP